MRDVASGGLLDLRVDREPVPDQRGAKRGALVGRRAQAIDIDGRGDAGYQNHRAVQCGRIAKCRE